MGKVKKEKISKPIVDSIKSKPSSPKKKKNAEDWNRKFAVIFPQSIKCMAESANIPGVTDEIANNLSEDVSYRLRSIIQLCAKYLKHTRHNCLRSVDVNEVFQMCDIPPVLGLGSYKSTCNFMPVKDAGVLILESPEVDLFTYALSEIVVPRKTAATVTGKWVPADDQKPKTNVDEIKTEPTEVSRVGATPNQLANPYAKADVDSKLIDNNRSEQVDNEPKLSKNITKYYGITCNTILGHSDLKPVFRDLSQNEKILPIVPYLLNFITITLNKLGSERQITRILQTVESLTENRKIDFRPYLPAIRVANALLKIIKTNSVERRRDAGVQTNNQHDRSSQKVMFSYSHSIRTRVAQVLAKVIRRWCCSEDQERILVKEMSKLLVDSRLPPRVHIGAIALLKELGSSALRAAFWNTLQSALTYTENARQDKSALELIIKGAAQVFYRDPHLGQTIECPSPAHLDRKLYEYFGDSISPLRLQLLENPQFLQRHVEATTSSKETKPVEPILKKTWRLPKCRNSIYNPEAKRITIGAAFQLPEFSKKRNPRLTFKFAGGNPLPEISLKRRRLDSRYSQFIAGKVSEGHVVLVGKFWRRPKSQPAFCPRKTASIFSII